MPTSWHYQLMRQYDEEFDTYYYTMHEYTHLDGKPLYTAGPISIEGESVEDVKWMLRSMLIDVHKHGVKDYE